MMEFFNWFDALPDRYFVYAFLFTFGFALGGLVHGFKNHR